LLALIIDTSLQGLTLGLVKIEGPGYEILEIYGSMHPQEAAARLPELCQGLLMNQNLRLENLDTLLISHGPGSFTGIKIGLSFASGWNRAGTRLKVYGLSSFQGLLKQIPDADALVLPATQTAGYLTMKSQGSVRIGVLDLNQLSVASLHEEASDSLHALDSKALTKVGVLGSWPKMEDWLTSQSIAWKTLETDKLYRAVVSGMTEDFIANSAQLSEGNLVPIYLRKSAPEEKLDALKAKG
jgi:tRNA A37 threonylcarbamoyladenosine modification protein TsaB